MGKKITKIGKNCTISTAKLEYIVKMSQKEVGVHSRQILHRSMAFYVQQC